MPADPSGAPAAGRLQHVRSVLGRATAVPPGVGGLPDRWRRPLRVGVAAYAVVLAVALFADGSGTTAEAAGGAAVAGIVGWVVIRRLDRRPALPAAVRRPALLAAVRRSLPVLYPVLIVVWLRTIASAVGGVAHISASQYATVAVIGWLGWHGVHGRWPPTVRRAFAWARASAARSRAAMPDVARRQPWQRRSLERRLRRWWRHRPMAGTTVPAAPATDDPRRRRIRGIRAAAVTWLLALAVLWVSGTGRLPDSLGGQVLTVTIALIAAGVLLIRRGQRPLASEVPIGDAPTILYLRSFATDGEGRRLGGIGRSVEQRLARGLADLGHLLAVGDPDERLPELGALRVYETDATWRERVEALMRSSTACVVQCQPSDGVVWEVGRSVELVDPARLVLFVPDPARTYASCRRLLGGLLPKGLPPLPDAPVGRTAFAVVAFDESWHAVAGVARSHDLVPTVHALLAE